MPLLLIVAGVAVALRQVATPCWLMEVFVVSEVDQVPKLSGASEQLPTALDCAVNCTWLPGGASVWSAVAVAGATLAVMVQLFCIELPQPEIKMPQHQRLSVARTLFIVTPAFIVGSSGGGYPAFAFACPISPISVRNRTAYTRNRELGSYVHLSTRHVFSALTRLGPEIAI
jgi:hypothetical protein